MKPINGLSMIRPGARAARARPRRRLRHRLRRHARACRIARRDRQGRQVRRYRRHRQAAQERARPEPDRRPRQSADRDRRAREVGQGGRGAGLGTQRRPGEDRPGRGERADDGLAQRRPAAGEVPGRQGRRGQQEGLDGTALRGHQRPRRRGQLPARQVRLHRRGLAQRHHAADDGRARQPRHHRHPVARPGRRSGHQEPGRRHRAGVRAKHYQAPDAVKILSTRTVRIGDGRPASGAGGQNSAK